MSETPRTPRSRTPSRSATPGIIRTPSGLAIAQLRPTLSLSNLHIHGHSTPSPPSPTIEPLPTPFVVPGVYYERPESYLESCASSTDETEGILVQDGDNDADTGVFDEREVVAVGTMASAAAAEFSKKTLRDHLRKTLSQRSSSTDLAMSRSWRLDKSLDLQDSLHTTEPHYVPRDYFVLTDAGKPVFCSRPDSPDLASILGIIQAIISVFLDESDKLRCINAGPTRITFLLRPPLYYAGVSAWGEPESVMRSHLDYLHLQILSIVSSAQLQRIFERRGNFDLRKLLNGAETFLTSLLNTLEFDLALSTASLHVLKLEDTLRKRAAMTLVPTGSRIKEVLYIVLVAQGKVITLIRPRKHSIHPADIHILLNTIHAPSIFSSPASASWIPLCLPKFNPKGFVNAYVEFLGREDTEAGTTGKQNPVKQSSIQKCDPQSNDPGIALVCVSGGGDFESIRSWCASIIERLGSEGTLTALLHAIHVGSTSYSVSELGIPGLRHFVYKSRGQVQVTSPLWEDPYDELTNRRRLTTLYQVLHDAIHARSGQSEPLKLQYIRTDKECVLGWITHPFELYIALSPRLPKSAAVGAANAVVKWVKKEEAKVFLRDAPVF